MTKLRRGYLDLVEVGRRVPLRPPLCRMELLGGYPREGTAYIRCLQPYHVLQIAGADRFVGRSDYGWPQLRRQIESPYAFMWGSGIIEILLETGAKLVFSPFNRKYYGGTGWSLSGYTFGGIDVIPYWLVMQGVADGMSVKQLQVEAECQYWKGIGAPKMAWLTLWFAGSTTSGLV